MNLPNICHRSECAICAEEKAQKEIIQKRLQKRIYKFMLSLNQPVGKLTESQADELEVEIKDEWAACKKEGIIDWDLSDLPSPKYPYSLDGK